MAEMQNNNATCGVSVVVTDMNPCGDNQVEVRLRFLRQELLYDIKNYAYVEHDMMDEQKKGLTLPEINHARHMTADIGEEGNVDRVSRILDLVLAEVGDMLYPYTKEPPREEQIDDILNVPTSYEMLLKVPENMSRTTMVYLSKLIHEYMVCRVLHDWLLFTDTNAAMTWKARADYLHEQIDTAKTRRRQEAFTRKMFP